MKTKRLQDLVKIDSTEDVLSEVRHILRLISAADDSRIVSSFAAIVNLFKGDFPGYQACNTYYHDLRHTLDTFLTVARLIHGATLENRTFTDHQIHLALIAALLHDAGYLQEENDTKGTGAKYTAIHVKRSMDFLERHGAEFGLHDAEIGDGCLMINCTDLAVDLATVDNPTPEIILLGEILGAADILAQMADPLYLEKLLFLYHEFKEGMIGGYDGELDLLRKTIGFYDIITKRLSIIAKEINSYMNAHFTKRWDIHENLYAIAIEKHRGYLVTILNQGEIDPREFLRRNKIVDQVRAIYGAE